jgi:phosphoadenosine phosphosulfate reductase
MTNLTRSTLDPLVDVVAATLVRIERAYAPAAFACSFGAEDMVLLDLIAKHARSIEVFTLDTGRLPDETQQVLREARQRYDIDIRVVLPDPAAVERYVLEHGLDGFYEGVPQRRACCHVRKVEPLARALADKRAWVSGLRREQSQDRTAIAAVQVDEGRGMLKFNPLVDWSAGDVWAYVRREHVPYNALHDRGYPSIGCAPCTRAVKPGEPERAGRWWWEEQGVRKECGLHAVPIRVATAEREVIGDSGLRQT